MELVYLWVEKHKNIEEFDKLFQQMLDSKRLKKVDKME